VSEERKCADCRHSSLDGAQCGHLTTSYTVASTNRRDGEKCGPQGRLFESWPDDTPARAATTGAADLLRTAQEIVNGDRQRDYGHPADNHACTGRLSEKWWDRADTAGNLAKLPPDVQSGVYVCAFNILQKLSRLAQTPTHTDSLRDIIGYCLNWQMILDRHASGGAEKKEAQS